MGSRWTAARRMVALSAGIAATVSLAQPTRAATINWKGHTWNVTGGGMAGVCQGSAANVSIDGSGYLHMKITNNGGTWTAAEIFSTDKLGFGTYQWQIEGPVDKLDKNVVVGLFPYGPAGGLGSSGNNEIDIEFARWGNAAWPNGNYTVWPPTGSTTGSHTFTFSLAGGTLITTRFTWSSTQIDFATLGGLVAVDGSTGLIDAWTFAPTNPTGKITQQAMPLGMNLWCFDNPPSDGQNVEIVVRDFAFVPLGASVDGGAGGAGGAAGTGGGRGSGGVGAGGAGGSDGSVRADAPAGRDGPGRNGDAAGSGGVAAGSTPGSGGAATGGSSRTGGAVGTGGLASGGMPSDGPLGTTSSGGSVGTGGASIGTGGAGNAGTVGAGGAPGSGGSNATGGSTARPATESAGCGCRVPGARPAPGSRALLLALALLLAGRQRKGRL